MSKINDGGPAFPTARVTLNGDTAIDGVECYGPGMSLRQWYAGHAMMAMLGSLHADELGDAAALSFLAADALIAAAALPSNQEQEERG